MGGASKAPLSTPAPPQPPSAHTPADDTASAGRRLTPAGAPASCRRRPRGEKCAEDDGCGTASRWASRPLSPPHALPSGTSGNERGLALHSRAECNCALQQRQRSCSSWFNSSSTAELLGSANQRTHILMRSRSVLARGTRPIHSELKTRRAPYSVSLS